jgi:hypothetical protein
MAMKKRATTEMTQSEVLSEMELALTVLWNSVHRWMSQRTQAENTSG